MSDGPLLRIEKAVYGGDGLTRTAAGEVVFVPFALPGELVQPELGGAVVVEASPERTAPRCVHFGRCGGCQYQMASYAAQLAMKAAILRETLQGAEGAELPAVQVLASAEPYGYRNRIRLRVREVEGALRLGYNVRGSRDFLPVRMCPLAAPVLWAAAEALQRGAAADREAAGWLRSAAEAEISTDADGTAVQIHLLCPGTVPRSGAGVAGLARHLLAEGVPLKGMGASRLQPASGRALEPLASFGAEGLAYRVGDESFWLKRGSFFQVNRFLLERMVELVCAGRGGPLAWDLYAGVGLFARRLMQGFAAVTAVEANAEAVEGLRRALRRTGDRAERDTTLAFLHKAVLQRDRPALVVLDPPRAGAGAEVCALLVRLAPPEIVYISCDPTTLARDLKVFAGLYRVADLHMLDLFPQTYHLETVMVLRRADVGG